MSALAHPDPSVEVDAPFAQGVVLFEEVENVEDDAVPQQASLLRMQDAGRNLMQDELVVAHVDGVTGVCTTLVASHQVRLLGQDVYDLALALVPPLTADHHQAVAVDTTFGHGALLCLERSL